MLDVAEKELRGYVDKRTRVYRVYLDGRERLYGLDWIRRKKEVWNRGEGRCEQVIELNSQPYGRCRNMMHDPHHIVKRSKKRDDRMSNLIGLCRMHHELMDGRKPMWSKDARDSRVSKTLA